MNLSAAEAHERFANSPVARLATADAAGVPHVVPVTFVVDGDMIYFAIDYKPKRSTDLRRLRNITENPAVAVIVDQYADDWSALWWTRADGQAEVLEEGDVRLHAISELRRKYHQYEDTPPDGPVVAIRVASWTGWAYAG
jgi:PPOX class probable F420-dependent enzyme